MTIGWPLVSCVLTLQGPFHVGYHSRTDWREVGSLTMPKAKVSVTIDKDLANEFDAYHRMLVVEAAKSGKLIPRQSNVFDKK